MAYPISTRKSSSNYIYSTGPDVCLTPMGSSMVPVPYNSVVFFDKSARTISHVQDNYNSDFNMNARGQGILGHEPGTGKGIKVPGYKKFAGPINSTATVYTDGRQIVRDGDKAKINSPTKQKDVSQSPWQKENL